MTKRSFYKMDSSTPIKRWWLLIARGIFYLATGVTLIFVTNTAVYLPALITGTLFIAAGLCGCAYAIFVLKVDRNYFWELIRSFFDICFGGAFLFYSQSNAGAFPEAFGFWAVMNASLQTVQAIYISMLMGGKQPRNIFGTQLHHLGVLLAIGLAYLVLSPATGDISWTLVGIVIFLLGLIIVLTAIQQRKILLKDKSD